MGSDFWCSGEGFAGFLACVLAEPHNADVLLSLQSALKWKVRPLVFLGVEEQGPWTETDRLLAEALTIYDRSLCPDCGHGKRLAWDDDLDGWFEVDDSIVCQACKARERYMSDNKESEPGVKIGIRLGPAYHDKT